MLLASSLIPLWSQSIPYIISVLLKSLRFVLWRDVVSRGECSTCTIEEGDNLHWGVCSAKTVWNQTLEDIVLIFFVLGGFLSAYLPFTPRGVLKSPPTPVSGSISSFWSTHLLHFEALGKVHTPSGSHVFLVNGHFSSYAISLLLPRNFLCPEVYSVWCCCGHSCFLLVSVCMEHFPSFYFWPVTSL